MNMSIINPEMDNCNLTGFETEEEMIDGLLKLLDEPTLFAQEHNTRHHNALSPNASFPMSPDNNTQDLNVQYSNAYLNALCPILPNNNAQELNTQHHNTSFPLSPNNNAQDLNAQHHNTLCPSVSFPMSPNNNTQELNTQHHNASFPMSPNNNAQDLNAQYPNAQNHNTLCPSASLPILPNNSAQHPDALFSTSPSSPSMTITVEENFTFRNPNEMKDSTGKTSTHGHLKGNITFKPPLDPKKVGKNLNHFWGNIGS